MKRKAQSETDIKRAVKEYLQWHGWFVFPVIQGLGAYRGISDLIALKAGETLFIEIKTPAGRLSAAQEVFQSDITAHDGVYIVVRGIEDIERVLHDV